MKTHVTIKDLALKLNISVSTVSRALRNASDIKPKTKEAVLKLAKELDYEPNSLAKSLVQRRTHLIGIIVPELDMQFFSTAIRGVQEESYKRGYNVLIAQSNESYELEVENVKAMVTSRLDGLIISLSTHTKDFSHLDKILRKGIPLVLFDRTSKNIDSSKVEADGEEGAYAATEHLIEQGYRRIAHIGGPPNLEISQKRFKGFLEAMKVNGMPVHDEYIINCDLTREDAYAKAQQLMSLTKPPDAIFAINDPVAIEAMKVIHEIGLKIPFHVGLVGFNSEPIADLLSPKLSSVTIPSKKMGQHAAQILIDQIEGENIRIVHEILPCDLVVRESSNKRAFLRQNRLSLNS
jgi:DNA-binding LacI/PurR family transcriptional regulator